MKATPRSSVLLVDDDAKLRRLVALRLESEGYRVSPYASPVAALDHLNEENPGLVIADLKMPEIDGVELLSRLQQLRPDLPVVLFSAFGDVPEAVRAVHAGAIDFLTKPLDWDRLLEILHNHLNNTESPADYAEAFGNVITTRSSVMQSLLDDAYRVAKSESGVLISGPSGSGKEVLARALHGASPRKDKPFIAVNCAAIPAELLESELFGHKRGSFTGAQFEHRGLFRAADGGTIFLDEIGDMPLALQAKLLRILEDRQVRPVGEITSTPIDVRVISATHRDLEALVEEKAFREDLFYRLNIVHLRLPSLEERREDIPVLVGQRLAQLAEGSGRRHVVSPEALNLLVAAPWPGNVRQLFNVVERAAVLTPGRVISASLVRRCLGRSEDTLTLSFDEARRDFSRRFLTGLLESAGGNVSRAARLAGRNRSDFYRLLSRYGLDPSDFKPVH